MGTDAHGYLTGGNEVNGGGFLSLLPQPARDLSELPSVRNFPFENLRPFAFTRRARARRGRSAVQTLASLRSLPPSSNFGATSAV